MSRSVYPSTRRIMAETREKVRKALGLDEAPPPAAAPDPEPLALTPEDERELHLARVAELVALERERVRAAERKPFRNALLQSECTEGPFNLSDYEKRYFNGWRKDNRLAPLEGDGPWMLCDAEAGRLQEMRGG